MADEPVDVVLLLDMLHYVDDEIAAAVFRRSFQMLAPGGLVVARCTIQASGRLSWSWRLEQARIRMAGYEAWYRSADRVAELLAESGFTVIVNEVTANPELAWLVGQATKEAAGVVPRL
jgi:cyclopropane fatty-acyl-phospholipid synthase-like methyltransferase